MEQIAENTADSLTESVKEVNQFTQYFQGKMPGLMDLGIKLVIVLIAFFVCRKIIQLILKIFGRSFERAGMEAASRTLHTFHYESHHVRDGGGSHGHFSRSVRSVGCCTDRLDGSRRCAGVKRIAFEYCGGIYLIVYETICQRRLYSRRHPWK